MDKTDKNDYSVKIKYCPGIRRNVIVKVDNSSKSEKCMDRSECEMKDCCSNINE